MRDGLTRLNHDDTKVSNDTKRHEDFVTFASFVTFLVKTVVPR